MQLVTTVAEAGKQSRISGGEQAASGLNCQHDSCVL